MEVLKHLIAQSGRTQKDIAAELGISQQRFNSYVTGIREPDLDLLIKIADFFGVSLDYLLGRTSTPLYKHTYMQNGQSVTVYTTKKEAPTPEEQESFLEMTDPHNAVDVKDFAFPPNFEKYIEGLVRKFLAEATDSTSKD